MDGPYFIGPFRPRPGVQKIIVGKKNTLSKQEKSLRINSQCTYGTTNRGLWDEKFAKLEDESKAEEIFHVIKNKINEIEGTDYMFGPYGKIKIKH